VISTVWDQLPSADIANAEVGGWRSAASDVLYRIH